MSRRASLRLVTEQTVVEELDPKGRRSGKRQRRITRNERAESRSQNIVAIPDRQEVASRYTKNIVAKSANQAVFMEAIEPSDLVFGLGPAGSGKTYIAVAKAVDLLLAGQVQKLFLTRPAVDAGEKLGFLPGDMKEKVDPYMRPLYDVLFERLGAAKTEGYIRAGIIEIAPLAFMRGRTLKNGILILDEAQNATEKQLWMAITRMGDGTKVIITGDPAQADELPSGKSGLLPVTQLLEATPTAGMAICKMNESDVVRHPLVKRLLTNLAKKGISLGT